MNARVRLGSWGYPSGNSVDVYLEPGDRAGVRHLALEWDDPPPLCTADLVHYLVVILPAVARRSAEYLEKVGPAVVVMV